jgi:hypothetical protein
MANLKYFLYPDSTLQVTISMSQLPQTQVQDNWGTVHMPQRPLKLFKLILSGLLILSLISLHRKYKQFPPEAFPSLLNQPWVLLPCPSHYPFSMVLCDLAACPLLLEAIGNKLSFKMTLF